jgi:Flp pilus assembly protein TadD
MKRLLFSMLILGLAACSSTEQPENLSSKVDALIANDQYETALELLDGQEETAEVLQLKEMTHLNYGMHLEYYSEQEMRVRMNSALMQFAEVLKINPDNEKAYSEVEQILGVYSTFPNRSPDEEVLEELRALGFEV